MATHRNKHFFQFIILLLIGGWSLIAQALEASLNTAAAEKKPLVVLISIDGFKPEYLKRGLSPSLNKLAENGAIASGLIPPFPSLTFPSHYSVVTGMHPDHHGIVNNTMYDPEIPKQVFKLSSREAVANPQWWSAGVPIWVTAAQQGKISSTLFWPGTEALNQGIQPKDWLPYDGKMTSKQRAEKLLEWLNRPEEKRADFATLYFSEVDSAGHEFGPKSEEVNASIQNVDNAIKDFVFGLDKLGLLAKTSFVITSDHGMAEVNEKNIIDIKASLKDYQQVTFKWFGPLAGLDVNTEQSQEVLATLKQQAHMQCWPKQNLPKQYHYGTHRRIPQIVCLAELGWTITDNPSRKPIPGQHGYDPYLTDMHGIFIASGYRVKQQKLDNVNNIDVYPLLMKLLSLDGDKRDADDHLIKLIEK